MNQTLIFEQSYAVKVVKAMAAVIEGNPKKDIILKAAKTLMSIDILFTKNPNMVKRKNLVVRTQEGSYNIDGSVIDIYKTLFLISGMNFEFHALPQPNVLIKTEKENISFILSESLNS